MFKSGDYTHRVPNYYDSETLDRTSSLEPRPVSTPDGVKGDIGGTRVVFGARWGRVSLEH